jgi:PEP-CTERM motif
MMADMMIDWAHMPFYGQGESFRNSIGIWYIKDGPFWRKCSECAPAVPSVTIEHAPAIQAAASVPEPSTVWLLGLAVVGLVVWQRLRARTTGI